MSDGLAYRNVVFGEVLFLFVQEVVRPQVQAQLVVVTEVLHLVLEYDRQLLLHCYHFYDEIEVEPIFVLTKEVLANDLLPLVLVFSAASSHLLPDQCQLDRLD